MSRYLALIRKQDFSDLYKYGIFHANRDLITEVVGDIDYIRSHVNYFKNIVAFANSFESTFTYLFVYYEKTNNSRICDIEIEEVLNIFPLDLEAKILLEGDFGSQIRFDDPLWPNAIEQLRIDQKISDCNKGVSNVWKIFELDQESLDECKNVLSNDVIKEVVSRKFQNSHSEGDLPLWVYLLMYERHAMYPNATLGFYMDAVHAAINHKAKCEFPSIESTSIFKYLDSLDYNISSKDIAAAVKDSPKSRNFIEYANCLLDRYDYMTVATIFFTLKDRYKDRFVYEKDFIEHCKRTWHKDFALAAYLLGWILGHDKTFECLYKKLPLHILEKPRIPAVIHSQLVDDQNPQETIPENGNKDGDSGISFPIQMGKYNKNGKLNKSCKPNPRTISSYLEYQDLKRKGWEEIK